MPGTDLDATARIAGSAVARVAAHTLILQGFALSMQEQRGVGFSSGQLAPYAAAINDAVRAAGEVSFACLNTAVPTAARTITGFTEYFQTQSYLAGALQQDSDVAAAIALLTAVQEQVASFNEQAVGLADGLRNLRARFVQSLADMDKAAAGLAVAADGNDGALRSIGAELRDIDDRIHRALTEVVESGLADPEGGIRIGVGALAEPAVAGASMAVVVGGVAIAAIGGSGDDVSRPLAEAMDAKSDLIAERARSNAETALAGGLVSGLKGLDWAASVAAAIAQTPVNAWTRIRDDLGALTAELKQGSTTPQKVGNALALAAPGGAGAVPSEIHRVLDQVITVDPVMDLRTTPGALVRKLAAARG
ncbi:HBL/NHE enterotoxin family protein [Actinospica robiniae]|uniref:HBL/NHE enterotoxin family protein n=1 Tax=Actinospica robiniae TaxID=304901 RepID=UPI000428F42B|nr:HBL/NHE enterotoxin family protein [Actinospica robiniae]